MHDWTAETRQRVFEEFYRLPAREVMDTGLTRAAFLPPHCNIGAVLDAFVAADHVWIHADGAPERRVESIVVRQDLLRALEPPNDSYTRVSRARFRSLAHGSADCVCCFTEGRVLHRAAPDTPCRDILRLMESKGVQYVPVVEDDLLVGEIGASHLLRAIQELRSREAAAP
jgi:CBS domain-containing protein